MKKISFYFLMFAFICSLVLSNSQIALGAGTEKTSPAMYKKILTAIKNGDSKVDLSSNIRNGQRFSWQILYDIENNEPTIFYLDYQKIQYWSNGILQLGYKYPKPTIISMQKTMNANADSIIKRVITKGMTDYQKVMALHDYMADYITYDTDNYYRNTIPENSYTAYGALVKRVAVCDGYTQAMNFLLRKVGIESIRVTGYGYQPDGSSAAHAWNLLKVNGFYYYMDLTWDDLDDKEKADSRYKYFLVTAQQLSKDHSWDKRELPAATNDKYKELHHIDNYSYKTKDGIFFSNEQDSDRLYFINLDGTGKKRLTIDRAISPVVFSTWIYFSNYSKGGYLYKMKTNGDQLTELNKTYTIPVMLRDGNLIVKDGETNKEFVYK